MFGPKVARRELDRYRKRGPEGTTRILVEALLGRRVSGASLLDIGGGIGAIQHSLLEAGATRALHVDASEAYLACSQEEAERRGHAERSQYRLGDFVALAPELEPADIITLDRVICCFPEMHAMVSQSARLGRRWYAASFPRDAWWTRWGFGLMNLGLALFRSGFRSFVHPVVEIESLLSRAGWIKDFEHQTWIWRVVVYRRIGADATASA